MAKKHHYVPRSILRKFRANPAKDQVHVFDKKNHQTFLSSIADAGCESQFNTIEIEGHRLSFEGLFQANDNILASVLEKINAIGNVSELDDVDRRAWSEVVAAQFLRTKIIRTSLRSLSEQMLKSLKEAGLQPGPTDAFSMPTEQDVRLTALRMVFDPGRIVESLQRKQLLLFQAADEGTFWISDNPVVQHNSFPYGELGFESPGIEVYMPIAHNRVIAFLCPSIASKLRDIANQSSIRDDGDTRTAIVRGLETGKPIQLTADAAVFLNMLQITQSSRFIYSSRNDFTLARAMISHDPGLRQIESLITAGGLGKGPPRNKRLGDGLWLVVYGRQSHHLLRLDHWDTSAAFIVGETSDLMTLQQIVSDEPLGMAAVYKNGYERQGMREIRLEVSGHGAKRNLCIKHRDEGMNQILVGRK